MILKRAWLGALILVEEDIKSRLDVRMQSCICTRRAAAHMSLSLLLPKPWLAAGPKHHLFAPRNNVSTQRIVKQNKAVARDLMAAGVGKEYVVLPTVRT
jgi:hypothetical protein